MDERNITGRTTDVRTEYDREVDIRRDTDRDVDIRRTAIMGRDYDAHGHQHIVAMAPMTKALRWGPIMAGLATSIVASLLLGSLFLGLGFDRSFGVFGGVTAGEFGWGAAIATLLAVFLGSYLAGYVSDLRARAEGVMNGFMVGVMAMLTPLIAALFGTTMAGAAAATNLPDTTNQAGAISGVGENIAGAVPGNVEAGVRNALVVAADNAWTVFTVGLLILAVSALGGYLGAKSREKALEGQARHEVDHATTY